jgi:site-specific DNA-methyltransferase (adenine-specific)
MTVDLRHGDCRDILKTLDDNSADAIVTDPPYHLTNRGGGPGGKGKDTAYSRSRAGASSAGFMGMTWDGGDIAHDPALWSECLRVAKPGAWLLAFGGTRTYHRLACAIEDAGWELRDSPVRGHMHQPEDCPWLMGWMFGSGFPKSKNLGGDWKGWGTALKPAWEPIVCARKPLAGTVEQNVLQFGVGAMNIDGCRVPIESDLDAEAFEFNHNGANRSTLSDGDKLGMHDGGWKVRKGEKEIPAGRWPANLIHDGSDEVVALFPQTTSGMMKAGTLRAAQDGPGSVCYGTYGGNATDSSTFGDSGSAARFFYCAKATRADRNDGCAGMEAKALNWSSGAQNPGTFQSENTNRSAENHHPTVKPTELMRYLCRLVTPPHGVVLDPFMGSGSTGRGAVLEGFEFIGIEREAEYIAISEARIAAARRQYDDEHRQMGLELVV